MKIDRNKIVLKRATKEDINTIIEYRVDFLSETYGNPSLELESKLIKNLRQYLKKALEDDTFISWIAEYEGKSVGFSGMVIRHQPANFEILGGKTGYILNMFTVKDYRKNGIGSLLFEKLIEEAKARHLDKVELHATKDGEPIYRQFGFVEPQYKAMELIL